MSYVVNAVGDVCGWMDVCECMWMYVVCGMTAVSVDAVDFF